MIHHFSRFPPGQHIYHPAIIFSAENDYQNEKIKHNQVQKQMPLAQDAMFVILADDDADDRELFGEVIAETGLNVQLEYAEDGKQLLVMLERLNKLPGIIFLDLNMPNKSGRECLQAIRQSEKLKHIPIVIYSTSSSPNDIDETFSRGANLYVRKPSSYQELLSMTRAVLGMDWNVYHPGASKTRFVYPPKQ